MSRMQNVMRRVRRGARLLDQHQGSGWEHKIDIGGLDLSSGCDCVLGQLYGGYHVASDVLRVPKENFRDLGFFLAEYEQFTVNAWGLLTHCWKILLTERVKSKPKQLPQVVITNTAKVSVPPPIAASV